MIYVFAGFLFIWLIWTNVRIKVLHANTQAVFDLVFEKLNRKAFE